MFKDTKLSSEKSYSKAHPTDGDTIIEQITAVHYQYNYTKTMCFVMPHHHSHRYKCNPNTRCRKNIYDNTRFPGAATTERLSQIVMSLQIPSCLQRIHSGKGKKKKRSSWLYKNIHFLGMHSATQHLVRLNSLKKEGKNERPHQFTKAKLKNKWHLLLTIAVGNLRGSITATHTHTHT